MKAWIYTRTVLAIGAALTIVGGLTAVPVAHAATPTTHWVVAALPPAAGTGLSRNEDGEPGLGITPSGQVWIGSDIAPYASSDPRINPVHGLLSGADVWSSSNDGQTFHWNSDPIAEAALKFGLGGEDTDLAVAPEKNAAGFYNIYLASLWIGSTGLAWSADGGRTWNLNRLGGVPAQDRPWLAADGACDVFLTYHQLPTFTPVIDDYNVCNNGNVPTTIGAALDYTHQTTLSLSDFPGLSSSFNKFVIDTSPTSPHRHAIYIPMSVCRVESAPDLVINANASNCPKGTVYIAAVSTDGGMTFTYHPVLTDPTGATLIWAATMASDAAGTVYFAWSNEKNSYLDVSRDGGVTWSPPRQINPKGTAAVYPTLAAAGAGRLDVAWYGTNRAGDSNDTKVMGRPNAGGSAVWHVDLGRSTNGGASFAVRAITSAIHRGELCTHGSSCGDANARNLLDDFGLGINPVTGLDTVAFTDDQPQGQAGTAFTAYATEVAATSARRGRFASASGAGAGAGQNGLAATGGGVASACAGLALLGVGLWLRRRNRVIG